MTTSGQPSHPLQVPAGADLEPYLSVTVPG